MNYKYSFYLQKKLIYTVTIFMGETHFFGKKILVQNLILNEYFHFLQHHKLQITK